MRNLEELGSQCLWWQSWLGATLLAPYPALRASLVWAWRPNHSRSGCPQPLLFPALWPTTAPCNQAMLSKPENSNAVPSFFPHTWNGPGPIPSPVSSVGVWGIRDPLHISREQRTFSGRLKSATRAPTPIGVTVANSASGTLPGVEAAHLFIHSTTGFVLQPRLYNGSPKPHHGRDYTNVHGRW